MLMSPPLLDDLDRLADVSDLRKTIAVNKKKSELEYTEALTEVRHTRESLKRVMQELDRNAPIIE